MFSLFFLAIFLQAGAYGLTFMLPNLFETFGANEKVVGAMLLITTLATLITVYFSGHFSDLLGRIQTVGLACLSISAALAFFALSDTVGAILIMASALLGIGWGLTYSLGPVVLSQLVNAEDRVRYFAILSVAIMAGFGLTPVLASALQQFGYTVKDAFLITSALCGFAGLIFFVIAAPVRRYSVGNSLNAISRLSLGNVVKIMSSPARLPIIMVCLGASVFAGLNNFQTVFADQRGLDYASYFLAYTLTVVVFRIVLARFKGGPNPYQTIAFLQYIMFASVVLFMMSGSSTPLYLAVAFLFGIGYGVSYPLLVAMVTNDADKDLVAQTLQFFALSYFVGVFGFPLIAGWMIVEHGLTALLTLTAALAILEATMALFRACSVRRLQAA